MAQQNPTNKEVAQMKAITLMPLAQLPKRYSNLKEDRITYGIPEFDHPLDFWEIFEKSSAGITSRDSNYPHFLPQRFGRFYGCQGFDIDGEVNYQVFNHISDLDNCSTWWRPSRKKGIHLMHRCNLDECPLKHYQDPIRQEYTELRGYDWFWSFKSYKPVKSAFSNGSYRGYEWKKVERVLDCIKLLGFDRRKFTRKLSRKRQKNFNMNITICNK